MATTGNFVCITGRATRDPEVKYTNSGSAVLSLGMAFNRSWKNKTTDEWEQETSFFNVTCWNELAENVGDTISKGMQFTVYGRLEEQTYTDKDGNEVRKVHIVADDVAVSLKGATADVTKVEKAEGGESKAKPRQQKRSEPSYDDEEPF